MVSLISQNLILQKTLESPLCMIIWLNGFQGFSGD